MLQRNISESSLETFRKNFFTRIKLAMTNLDSILKSRDITLLTKVHIVKFMVFPLVIYRCELDNKESWAPKNWCFQIVMLEKMLQSPLDCKEIKPVNTKGNQSWIFTGKTDAEVEAPILWLPDVKSWLIRKEPDAGKDWRQEKKRAREDEMVGWHHWLNGHEFQQAPEDGEGQGNSLLQSTGLQRVGHDGATEQQRLCDYQYF